ncbi:tetratricopeptide repeat protein 7B-like isoform X2 [Gambusia affinis]|uniref:tetratricopeptide repeat protein 7B-like isoform X2 n=1 Tax=Gambusia affinis TaxID=33528 RepID=UPI001CDC5746|nr:tetratricopeptide repeat protein 7B-like isoform X2 [Gambusia affinis]
MSSGSPLETEFQRCRSEGRWEQIPQLVQRLTKSKADLAELLLGESKLQAYLKEHPITRDSSPPGTQVELVEVKNHLTAAMDRGNLRADYLQEASLLMAKLCYIEGEHSEALSHYSQVNLDDLQLVGAPVYRLSMIAEAYATKGMCLEKIPDSSPSTNRSSAAREQEIITCYEKSGDIALLYLQEAEKASSAGIQKRSPKPGPPTQDLELSYFLETGLQRAHIIHFHNGNLMQVMGRFREILQAVETRTTQNLRMTIARQLAEILLRGMCGQSYWSPLEDPPTESPVDEPKKKGHTYLKNYTLSRTPQVYSGENLFCPQDSTEEALLLLLISESVANQDAVLSRTPEDSNDRAISLQSASAVYDLLTIVLGKRGQYKMLSELDEGEKFAKMVIEMRTLEAEFKAKGHLAIGLVYSLKATDASLRSTQEDYQRKALSAFRRAHRMSPTDHLAAFYLALQLAFTRQIPEALGKVRRAMQLQEEDVHTLHLLALLLSAQKQYQDALKTIETALSGYPENFTLLYTKVKLEAMCRGPEEALLTCKHMLRLWKRLYDLTNTSDSGLDSSLLDRAIPERQQLNAMSLPDISDPDAGSERAASIAASRAEQALSEDASSLQSSAPKPGPPHAWLTLAQIWLHAAEVYIGMKKPEEATSCTQEAANLSPTSHNMMHMRGQIAELKGNLDEAKQWYEEALSINPTHVKSMQRLGVILHQLKHYSLSEKVLRGALEVNSSSHEAWNSLGEVLRAQGNDATECFLTALELEASSPILPFTIIPRAL